MPTVIVYHEIDDSEHWLAAPKRTEVLGPLGIKARTFLDSQNPHRSAVLLEVPDMEAFIEYANSETAAEARARDGVRIETLVILSEV